MSRHFYSIELFFTVTFICFIFVSCQKAPEPISYSNDSCDNCKMTISDPKFGAELITNRGKIYKFDSIECLSAFYGSMKEEEIHSVWVTDYLTPEKFINTADAYFLVSEKLKSPMGLNISAFADQNSLDKIKADYGGKVLSWKDVQSYVKNEWQ